jgi:hypothetical protein
MPGMWLGVKGILSEFPYIALVLAAILQRRHAIAGSSRTRYAVLCLLIAAVVLTRTIGVALVAALVVVEARAWLRVRDAARLKSMAIALAVSLAIVATWYVLRPSGGEDAYLAFGSGMARGTTERGLDWTLGVVANNASALVDAWLAAMLIFWGEPWKPAFLLASFVGLSGVAGTLWRAIEWEFDAIYVLFFAAILAVWPFPGQMYRLALPAMPLLILNAFYLWMRVAERASRERAVRWSALAALAPLAICIPAVLFYIVERARLPGTELGAGYRLTDISEFYRIPLRPAAEANATLEIGVLADFDRIRKTTPDSARIMWYLPGYVALLAGREGIPLVRPSDQAALATQVTARRPDYVYLSSVHPRDTAHRDGDPMQALPYLRERGDIVWQRANAAGTTESVLLKIDPTRLLRQ